MIFLFNNNLNPPNRGLFFYVKVLDKSIVYVNISCKFTSAIKLNTKKIEIMNLTKKQFKSQYSNYRKRLNDSYFLGKDAFIKQMNSNSIFREVSTKMERPVSIKIWLHKNS